MISAFFKAFTQLGEAQILKYLLGSAFSAAAVFAALWAGAGWALALFTADMGGVFGVFGAVAAWFGGAAAALILTWLLFPAVLSAFVVLFLDGVAAAAEARHHPGLPPARGQPLWAAALNALRFLAVAAGLNLLILPVLVIPGLNLAFPALYYAVNGYLLGREYFETAALRRLSLTEAREMRRRRRFPVFAAGLTAAFLLTVPGINLIAPVIAAAAMVHLFHSWRGGANLAA